MADNQLSVHYVSTHEEAWALAQKHEKFWVANCGCREGKKSCSQSRMDVCLTFYDDVATSGSGKRELDLAGVQEIFKEAASKQLVTRPFRSDDRTRIDGICNCCYDCCYYFKNHNDKCDKGISVQKTNMDDCTQCGSCEDICHFEARKMEAGLLNIVNENCFGCGLCVDVCPTGCIEMVSRN